MSFLLESYCLTIRLAMLNLHYMVKLNYYYPPFPVTIQTFKLFQYSPNARHSASLVVVVVVMVYLEMGQKN